METHRLNSILKFLKISRREYELIVSETELSQLDFNPNQKLNLTQIEDIFDCYAKFLCKLFLEEKRKLNQNVDVVEQKKVKSNSRFNNRDIVKTENPKFIKEFNLINSLKECVRYELLEDLKIEVENFEQNSKFSKNEYFLNFKEKVFSENIDFLKIEELMNIMSDFILREEEKEETEKHYKILEERLREKGVFFEDNTYERQEDDVDSTKWEEIIMNAFRDGEEDRFGY